MDAILHSLLDEMDSRGIVPTEDIIADGTVHRFHIKGDTANKRNGWVIVNTGSFPSAIFGSWKTGAKHRWHFKQPMTADEEKQARRELYQLQKKNALDMDRKHAQAVETAGQVIANAAPASQNHPYLVSKQIKPCGALQSDNVLIIPLYHEGKLVSLQAIYPEGGKRFLQGGRVTGCYFLIGEVTDRLLIAEGFATAATLHEKYNTPVAVAFNAGNLSAVAQTMHKQYPDADIKVAADNDQWTADNPGMRNARIAAALIKAPLIYPVFDDLDVSSKPTDFNDYFRLGGAL